MYVVASCVFSPSFAFSARICHLRVAFVSYVSFHVARFVHPDLIKNDYSENPHIKFNQIIILKKNCVANYLPICVSPGADSSLCLCFLYLFLCLRTGVICLFKYRYSSGNGPGCRRKPANCTLFSGSNCLPPIGGFSTTLRSVLLSYRVNKMDLVKKIALKKIGKCMQHIQHKKCLYSQ